MIGSTSDVNQGWRFGEMTAAIAALPAGEHQARQQMYFDALQLLAVFVQHGDRKPSQQRLVCLSADRPRGRRSPGGRRRWRLSRAGVPRAARRPGVRAVRHHRAGPRRHLWRRWAIHLERAGEDAPVVVGEHRALHHAHARAAPQWPGDGLPRQRGDVGLRRQGRRGQSPRRRSRPALPATSGWRRSPPNTCAPSSTPRG